MKRTYKGMVAPYWAEYVVFGPLSGDPYWARRGMRQQVQSPYHPIENDTHNRCNWRRAELDPLPVEVWGVFGAGSVVDARLLNTYPTEEAAADKARELARGYTGRTFIVARITQKITQPKPVLPEPIVEKL